MSDTIQFFIENDQYSFPPNAILRSSFGVLAAQILAQTKDLSKMSYADILEETYQIILKLNEEYQRGNFIGRI